MIRCLRGPALAPDAALAIGQGVIAGEVFDDSTGLPLADVAVALVSLDGIPSPPPASTALTDARGRYRLPSAAGLARLQITKPGFTAAERLVQVVAGARVPPLDARLTPLDPNATVISGIVGGTATDASGERVLFVPPGALAGDQALQITPVGGQSLIQSLPAGWSPMAAVDVTPGGLALTQPAVLTLPAPAGAPAASQLTPVQWDPEEQAWLVLSPPALTADSQKLVLPLVTTGQVAILVPDLPPNQPPTPVVGQPLAGVSPAPLPGDLTAAISPSPQILVTAPDARSLVQVHAQSGAFVPSGAALRLDIAEAYDFVAGTHLYPEPVTQDLHSLSLPEPRCRGSPRRRHPLAFSLLCHP